MTTLIRGLDLLVLEVNKLEESVEFYGEKLGLETESIGLDAEPPMARLRAGNLRITLVQQLETLLRRGRGVHFFLTVDDVDGYFECLKSRGMVISPPTDEGWGGRFITVEDPDHYRLFFVEWANA